MLNLEFTQLILECIRLNVEFRMLFVGKESRKSRVHFYHSFFGMHAYFSQLKNISEAYSYIIRRLLRDLPQVNEGEVGDAGFLENSPFSFSTSTLPFQSRNLNTDAT